MQILLWSAEAQGDRTSDPVVLGLCPCEFLRKEKTMSQTFEHCRSFFKEKGFFLTAHPVVLHHLRKDFVEYDVVRDRYYILPIGENFLHVALVEYSYAPDNKTVLVRYTCAGDDLLYGLRTKFNSGGALHVEENLVEIERLLEQKDLGSHPRYVRKRFRHGRTKAKVRATLVMIADSWKNLISAFKVRPT